MHCGCLSDILMNSASCCRLGSVGNLINDKDDILIRYLEKLENWSDLNRFYKMLLIDRQVKHPLMPLIFGG